MIDGPFFCDLILKLKL